MGAFLIVGRAHWAIGGRIGACFCLIVGSHIALEETIIDEVVLVRRSDELSSDADAISIVEILTRTTFSALPLAELVRFVEEVPRLAFYYRHTALQRVVEVLTGRTVCIDILAGMISGVVELPRCA